MQTLKLANDLFAAIEDHGKSLTIRKGIRPIHCGPLLFEPVDPGVEPVEVFVEKVEVARAKYVRPIIWELDGFASYEAALVGMRRFYPDFGPDTEVTIVHFRLAF